MKRNMYLKNRTGFVAVVAVVFTLTVWGICFGSDAKTGKQSLSAYEQWKAVGRLAAETSLDRIAKEAADYKKTNLIVLTNAGYAEVNGEPTQGALDGVTEVTGASRGRYTLVEIQASPWSPLWFAVYDKGSGCCVYSEVDASKAVVAGKGSSADLFRISSLERIDADRIFADPSGYDAKFKDKMFGGNAFRIVAVANAVAAGAPPCAIRAFEFHDHYCPGVVSGIFMARYLYKHYPPGKSGYFVHAVEPWCKEDALMVLLNATPGKRRYAVSYPTKSDMARRLPELQEASTIVYRKNEQTERWEGMLIEFEWADTGCPKTGSGAIDRLCSDMWYLKGLDKPEDFVKVVKTFELPDGTSPKDWARPGVDPLEKLGLVGK